MTSILFNNYYNDLASDSSSSYFVDQSEVCQLVVRNKVSDLVTLATRFVTEHGPASRLGELVSK